MTTLDQATSQGWCTWAIHLFVFKASQAPLDSSHLFFSFPELQHDHRPDDNEHCEGNLDGAAKIVDGDDINLQGNSNERRSSEPKIVVPHKLEIESNLLPKIFLDLGDEVW
jgi:hypothetical protein